ncbi:DUF2637 domain-containing protein [Streptomyces sp. S6]
MHRVLIGVVVAGAVVIAGIGFAGSYAAVRELAVKKGFGNFSYFLPIGIDAGICVLLALDLLLTWIRMPFPLLRQTAWVLTAATIAFNAAAAEDLLGMGMHAVIPILFVVTIEAARHAVGRIADITADRHMEGVRITRWLLSPIPTFLLWRRMKLWELRSYDQVIKLEQDRLVYQARLQSRYGRAWRRKAPVESVMPLRLARYGIPLSETAPAGLAAAGIDPVLIPPPPVLPQPQQQELPPAPAPVEQKQPELPAQRQPLLQKQEQLPQPQQEPEPEPEPGPEESPWFHQKAPAETQYQGGYDPNYNPEAAYADWYAQEVQAEQYAAQFQQEPPVEEPSPEETGTFPIPSGPGRTRELGEGGGTEPDEEAYYTVFKKSINGSYPTPREFSENAEAEFTLPLSVEDAKRMVNRFTNRYNAELEEDHIA